MAHVMSGSAPRRVGVGPSNSDRISATGAALRRSLSDVTAVFAPSCIAHEVLTRPDWAGVAVNGVTLPDAIQCWADSIANEQGEEESSVTLEDVLHSLGVEFRTSDLPVSDQGNQIVVPVSRIHRFV